MFRINVCKCVSIKFSKSETYLQTEACKWTRHPKSKVVRGLRHRFWSPGSLGRRFMEALRMWRPAEAQTAALFLALVLSHLCSEGKRRPGSTWRISWGVGAGVVFHQRLSLTVAVNFFFFFLNWCFRYLEKLWPGSNFMVLFGSVTCGESRGWWGVHVITFRFTNKPHRLSYPIFDWRQFTDYVSSFISAFFTHTKNCVLTFTYK